MVAVCAQIATLTSSVPAGLAKSKAMCRYSILGYFLKREFLMCVLRDNEYALLALAALKPFAYVPFKNRRVAARLLRQGLLCRRNGQWYPTEVGLKRLGHTIH